MGDMAQRVVERFLASAKYDPESWYYDYEPGMTLETILERWQKQRPGKDKWGNPLPRQKMYDRSMPVMMPLSVIWPFREYTWSREDSRRSPEEWDELEESMKQHGWKPSDPLLFVIGQKGGAKVGEGNHRLAIARKLRIEHIPVNFSFNSGTVTKNPQHG